MPNWNDKEAALLKTAVKAAWADVAWLYQLIEEGNWDQSTWEDAVYELRQSTYLLRKRVGDTED